ncbi:MAG: hypothetical protein JWO26_1905 [Rhodospirillales bacterium]|nr:hypothetical protein [Rhodospirillales bacterium]
MPTNAALQAPGVRKSEPARYPRVLRTGARSGWPVDCPLLGCPIGTGQATPDVPVNLTELEVVGPRVLVQAVSKPLDPVRVLLRQYPGQHLQMLGHKIYYPEGRQS